MRNRPSTISPFAPPSPMSPEVRRPTLPGAFAPSATFPGWGPKLG